MRASIDGVAEYAAGTRASQAGLVGALGGLRDDQVRRPSRLPGWSVGHVLTHIARNADSVVRRLAGARRDEIVDQYVGGREGRELEIAEGAGRSAAELVDDIARTSAGVDIACSQMPAEAWSRLTRGVGGGLSPAYAVVFSRWREVEVHHVDLGLGYEPDRWPARLVEIWLPDVVEGLPGRADPRALLAWSVGRGAAPELADWG
jgi:maleylpyruvate isomerase